MASNPAKTRKRPGPVSPGQQKTLWHHDMEHDYSLASFDFFLICAGFGVAAFLFAAGIALMAWAGVPI